MNSDFERISRIISKLERAWTYVPSYSLGKFLWLWSVDKKTTDSELEESLNKYLREIANYEKTSSRGDGK